MGDEHGISSFYLKIKHHAGSKRSCGKFSGDIHLILILFLVYEVEAIFSPRLDCEAYLTIRLIN